MIATDENHDTMQILCYYGNIVNMFQRKSLNLQCKKTISKKEEMIRLYSDSLKVQSCRFV